MSYTGNIPEDASIWPTLWRGWRRTCPNCGSGPLLSGYLKVREACPVCRQELHHHRADDGPAYLTLLIVGHLMAPLLLFVFETWRPEPLVLFTIFTVGCVGLSLYLLPRLKGAIIGFQWARGMGGFARRPDRDPRRPADDPDAAAPVAAPEDDGSDPQAADYFRS